MKKLLKILLALVVLLLAVVLLSPLWIGPVVCSVANSVVPTKTKTPFHLGNFQLNGYTGRLALGDMQLGNPEGCEPQQAVNLGNLTVDVDAASLLSDTIVIRNLEVHDLFVAYVSDRAGRNNFKVIMANVQGEKAQPAAPAEQSAAQVPTASQPEAQPAAKPAGKQSEAPARSKRKVIIDRVSIAGVRVQIGRLTLPVPSLTLTGIGRKSNGVLLQDAYKEITDKVMSSLGILGDGLKNLKVPESIKNVSEEANRVLKNAGDAAGKATETLKATGEQANKALESVKSVGGNAGNAAGTAVKSVSEGAGSAVKSVSEGAGNAVKSVGETTEKATELIKGLFN